MKCLVLSTVFLVMIYIPAFSRDLPDAIGFYFSEAGTVNCLPDSTSFPFMLPAYLIIENVTDSGGIAAWEGALDYDSELLIVLDELSGNAINFAEFPEFNVGLDEPLPPSDSILLATFRDG